MQTFLLQFFVSTNPACSFRIDIYRMGYYGGDGGRLVTKLVLCQFLILGFETTQVVAGRKVASSRTLILGLVEALGPFEGKTQADPPVDDKRLRDCPWDSCASLKIPSGWLSGVYLGKLTAEKEGLQSYVIFIVRDDRKADLVFQCSDHTWQAYNRWPNQFSLYDNGEHEWWWGGDVQVSFHRPYGKYRQIVDAPLSIGSGEWFLWEFPFAFWLESEGYDVTYISNRDTHADPGGLRRAKGFLSVGHGEYYSIEMFRNLQAAIEQWHGDPASIPDLEVVATAPTKFDGKHNGGQFTATVYPGPHGNVVFNAATCWWGDGLSAPPGYVRPSASSSPQGPDARVQQITRNVLRRMIGMDRTENR